MSLLDQLRPLLARTGLNHVGVVGRARYDAAAPSHLAASVLHPTTRSVVVIGSGGSAHFRSFLAWAAVDPEARVAAREHPLDDFCAEAFAGFGAELAGCRVVFPTMRAEVRLDFLKLAALAGLGGESELGILVGERFGPWFGLRAAIFTPEELDETFERPAPCIDCPAPCRASCPAGVVGVRPFPWRGCVDARASTCVSRCAAREACIVAPEARYDELELRYHHDPIAARGALLAHLALLASPR